MDGRRFHMAAPPATIRLGLICGAGRFPVMVAEGMKKSGHEVVAVGLSGLADPAIARLADRFCWSGVVRPGRWIRFLRRQGCKNAILAGSVRKADMYGHAALVRFARYMPDWTALKLWFFKVEDRRNDTLLRALADEFAEKGIVLEDCVKYTPEAMATEGVMTERQPTAAQERDIAFGWRIAKEMGRLDIGQSIAVKEQDVIAVEAIEGTDRMIERAGQLCRSGGWCHIKVGKPDQDMRFDVPTIGPDTIENLHRNGAAVLCIEAGKTFVVDREEMLALAAKLDIAIVGRRDPTDH